MKRYHPPKSLNLIGHLFFVFLISFLVVVDC